MRSNPLNRLSVDGLLRYGAWASVGGGFRVALRLVPLVLGALLFAGCARPPHGQQRPVTLVAVGDIFFARGVARAIAKHGPDYPFAATDRIIRRADIAFCNLECPLSTRGIPQRRRYLFRCDPAYAKRLRDHGYDAISLANNHTLDYGRDALTDTITCLRSAHLTCFGAGTDRRDARRLRIIDKNGLRVGFIGYNDITPPGVVQADDKPDVARLDTGSLAREVRAAKSRCDVLVVSMHWGIEYMKHPTERQRKLAQLCIDSGADLVLGHHPHVLQPVETYKGRPIIYSLGAFIWDARIFDADKSAILRFELRKSSARILATTPVTVKAAQPRLSHP